MVQSTLSELEKGYRPRKNSILDEWFLGQQRAIMANQKAAIKEADIKALFHALCTGASSMQDTNAALAFQIHSAGGGSQSRNRKRVDYDL